jgi:hypothetical protein
MDKATFTISKEVSFVELWEAIWGSDGSGIVYWCSKIRKPDGSDIDLWVKGEDGRLVGNPQDFKVYDFEEEKWHTCSLEQLAKGYELAVNQNLRHCGGSITGDLDDADECSGDQIIQMAIFGELIYG